MSKGHGSTMRRVLDAVGDDWQTVVQLAGPGASRSEREAVRRACKRLATQGHLDENYVQPDDDGTWSAVIAERGYPDDARPAHPGWQYAVKRAGGDR